MVVEHFIDNKIARVTDILMQVQKLNEMIDFHTKNSSDDGMKAQYISMRQQFLGELNTLLDNFQISANLKIKIA
jgi:hypothetical protein